MPTHTVFANDDEEQPIDDDEIDDEDKCKVDPFSKGCRTAGLGVSFSASGSGGTQFGLSGYFGYFIFDRTTLSLGGSAIFGTPGQYQVGPSLGYYIGPILSWMIIPSYKIEKYWVTGSASSTGFIHGPGVVAQTKFGERLYLGIRFDYLFIRPDGGTNSADWYLNPAMSYYF